MNHAERYVRLGLRIGRHDDGVVDAYFGPAEIAADVDAEPLSDLSTLVAEADALLADLGDTWLRDQVTGLRTYLDVLAGATLPYDEEVLGCFGVRPEHTDEAVFAAAHAELDAVLPGAGPLAERHERWQASIRVPPERIERGVAAVIATARELTDELLGLPDGEGTTLEIVRDVPWRAYSYYLGGFRGRIAVNVELPMSALELLTTALHEGYPGHQAERALKEAHLDLLEETIVLAPTPQSLVSEGIGMLAPSVLLAGPGGAALAAAVGVDFDLAQALAVARAVEPLQWAEINAALMRHAGGAGAAEVRDYLQRWELLGPELAAHVERFIGRRSTRSYITAYPAGLARCRAYVGGDPERFRRLLTTQVRVGDL